MSIQIKRIYDPPETSDGYRILVDRLWSRGIRKEYAKIDEWLKDLAPSTVLRKWFNHEASKFDDFKVKYIEELQDKKALLEKLLKKSETETVTLLYGAKDEKHNQAVVLLEAIGLL